MPTPVREKIERNTVALKNGVLEILRILSEDF